MTEQDKQTRRRQKRTRGPETVPPSVIPGTPSTAFRPLKDTEVSRIIDAAYEVLDRTGIEVTSRPMRDVFRRAGAREDEDRARVHIPASVIDSALRSARKDVVLAGRKPELDLNLGGARVYLGTGGSAVKTMDLDGTVRDSTLRDNYDIGRLCDTLDHVHFYMRPVVARDLKTEDIGINSYYACLAATEKHVMSNEYLAHQVGDVRDLGNMVSGGAASFDARPCLSFALGFTVSPLRFAVETIEILDEVVRHGIPVALSSAPQAGATAPAALAGTLVQITAEQLSGFVYVNLLSPGHPTLMGCVPAQADLRSGAFVGGSGEFALLNAAVAQVAQALQIPIYNSSGIADSKLPDAQAGFEKGMTTAIVALAGSNYVHHSVGFLESLMTVAYEQFVIDNDINGAVMRLVRGIEVTEDTLSLDVIDAACRTDQHFLNQPQTLALMNSEYVYPKIFDRASRDDWEERGAQDIREVARTEARRVLDTHYPTPIPAALDADIRKQFNILLPRDVMAPRKEHAL